MTFLANDPDLDALHAALERLCHSVGALGADGAGRQEALKDVFRVNREIGRLAMDFGWMRPVLREVQLEVNLVTVDVKRGRTEEARERVAKVSSSLERAARAARVAGRSALHN